LGVMSHWAQTWGEIHEGKEPVGCYGSINLGQMYNYADAKHAMLTHETCSQTGYYLMYNPTYFYWGTWCCSAKIPGTKEDRKLVPSTWTTYKLHQAKVETDWEEIKLNTGVYCRYNYVNLGHHKTYDGAMEAMLSHPIVSQGDYSMVFPDPKGYRPQSTWCCKTRHSQYWEFYSPGNTYYILKKHSSVYGRRLLSQKPTCVPLFNTGPKKCAANAFESVAEIELKKRITNKDIKKIFKMGMDKLKKMANVCYGDMPLNEFEKDKKDSLDSMGCGGLANLDATKESHITLLSGVLKEMGICMTITQCNAKGVTLSFAATKAAIEKFNEIIGGPLFKLVFNLKTISFGYSTSSSFGHKFSYYDGTTKHENVEFNGNFYLKIDYKFNIWDVVKKEFEDGKKEWIVGKLVGALAGIFPITLENHSYLSVNLPILDEFIDCAFGKNGECSKDDVLEKLQSTEFLMTTSGKLAIDFSKIHDLWPKFEIDISDGYIYGKVSEGLFITYSASNNAFKMFTQFCDFMKEHLDCHCPTPDRHVLNFNIWFTGSKMGVKIHQDFSNFYLKLELHLDDGSIHGQVKYLQYDEPFDITPLKQSDDGTYHDYEWHGHNSHGKRWGNVLQRSSSRLTLYHRGG